MAVSDLEKIQISADIKDAILSGDAQMRKNAALASSDYFRTEVRENAVYRSIVNPTNITAEQLADDETSDLPSVMVEIAPRSHGASVVNFETGPQGDKAFGKKLRVGLGRIMTKKYEFDKARLATYKMPILDILYDLLLKDLMDAEDSSWLAANTSIAGDPADQTAQFAEFGFRRSIYQNFDRAGVGEVKKGLMLSRNDLKPTKQVIHQLLYADFYNFDRTEVGGDLSQEMFVNGTTMTKINGIDTLVTSKREACAEDEIWVFTDPIYYGGFFIFDDVTLVIDEKDGITHTFFAHEMIGGAVVNREVPARVVFSSSETSTYWRTAPETEDDNG